MSPLPLPEDWPMVLRERSSIGAGETERGGVRVFDFWGFQVMASPSRAVPLPPATHSVKRTCLERVCAKIMQTIRTCIARVWSFSIDDWAAGKCFYLTPPFCPRSETLSSRQFCNLVSFTAAVKSKIFKGWKIKIERKLM